MSQNQNDQQNDPQGGQGTDLASELRELGQQIEQSVRAALDSERAKTIRRDLASGLNEIGKQVQGAVKSLQTNPRVQDLADRGQKVVNQAQDSPAMKDFQDTLAKGVAQLNERLAAFVARVENANSGAGSSTQQVPVEDASQPTDIDPTPPTTGATTRL